MLAIGGAIGTGLFLGSALAVSLAGPLVLVAYLLGSIIALILVYAATEMAAAHPEANGFGALAHRYLGSGAGYVMRWMYWAVTAVTMGAEAVAVGIYIQYWWPSVPLWVPVAVAAAGVIVINLLSVKTFGTLEYWLSMIKVSAIVAFLLIGFTYVFFGLPDRPATGMSSLTDAPSLLPQGIAGLSIAIVLVMFSFGGIEAVTMTAPESANPRRDLPRAARWTIFRLALFYLLSMVVVLSISSALGKTPDGKLDASPFVQLFAVIGLPAAAAVMNFVVLTAALSSLNTILYVAVRTIYSLGTDKQAPSVVTRLSKRGIPVNAVLISAVGLVLAATITIVSPDTAFLQMLGIASFGGLTTWAIILLTHVAFRRGKTAQELRELPIRLPGAPWTSGLAALALAAMVTGMFFIPMFESAWIVGAPFVALVTISYFILLRRRPNTFSS
jgi:L-asparagine transporter-like permease